MLRKPIRRKATLRVEPLENRVLLNGGTDFLVNPITAGDQMNSSVAVDGRGNYVVAWRGFTSSSDTGDIYAQRFDPSGNPIGSEFRVNTITAGTQDFPKVATDSA